MPIRVPWPLPPRHLQAGFALAAAFSIWVAVKHRVIEGWRDAVRSGGWQLDELLLLALMVAIVALVVNRRTLSRVHRDLVSRATEIARAHELALRDPLTGLLNRRGLDEAIARQGSSRRLIFVADLDTFKSVNDVHGHAVGDLLLQRLADRLRILQDDFRGIAARVGGDEFVFVAPATHQEETVHKRLAEPLQIEPIGRVGISVGLAHCDTVPAVEQALRNADLAMYKAKRARLATRDAHDSRAGRSPERYPAVASAPAVIAIGAE
jgi:diguanylate cyclase (GGDEF)-like protein